MDRIFLGGGGGRGVNKQMNCLLLYTCSLFTMKVMSTVFFKSSYACYFSRLLCLRDTRVTSTLFFHLVLI